MNLPPLFWSYTMIDNTISTSAKHTNNPLFKQIKVKFRFIISEPFNVLCRIISVKRVVSPDNPVTEVSTNHHINCTKTANGVEVKIVKNIPNDVTIIAVGNSHHIIYLIKANLSIAIPVSAE